MMNRSYKYYLYIFVLYIMIFKVSYVGRQEKRMKTNLFLMWIEKYMVFESKYSMMVVPSWSTVCNDRIENKVKS